MSSKQSKTTASEMAREKLVSVMVEPEFLKQIDEARAFESRSSFLYRMIKKGMKTYGHSEEE